MSYFRERAPLSQRIKTMCLVCGALGGAAGMMLLAVLTRGRFRGRP